jgi:TRAP-type C4-dicarboxylate transport system permease small subunit
MFKTIINIKRLNKIDGGIYAVEKYLAMVGLYSLILLITIQVVARYILKASTPWSEELARYVFIWTSYLGCGMCFAKKKHININLIDEIVSKYENASMILFYVEKLTMVASIAFLGFFLTKYWTYFLRIASLGRTSTACNLPMVIPYFSVLAGCALMMWHAFVILLQSYQDE